MVLLNHINNNDPYFTKADRYQAQAVVQALNNSKFVRTASSVIMENQLFNPIQINIKLQNKNLLQVQFYLII
jgi:hypothetical protein